MYMGLIHRLYYDGGYFILREYLAASLINEIDKRLKDGGKTVDDVQACYFSQQVHIERGTIEWTGIVVINEEQLVASVETRQCELIGEDAKMVCLLMDYYWNRYYRYEVSFDQQELDKITDELNNELTTNKE